MKDPCYIYGKKKEGCNAYSMFCRLQLTDKSLNLRQEALVLSQQLDIVVVVGLVTIGALVDAAGTVRVVHVIRCWLAITPM